MSQFKEKFNRATGNKFDYLRLSQINVSAQNKTAEFCFVAPEGVYETALNSLQEIQRGVEAAYGTDLRVNVRVKKSHFDEYFFSLDVIKFFDSFASLKNCVNKRNIFFKNENEKHYVEILLKESEYSLFQDRNLTKELNDFIAGNYCEDIAISMRLSDEKEEFLEDEPESYTYDDPSGRFIDVQNQEGLTGLTVYDKPGYISDAVNPAERIVLCGKIVDFREIERKVQADGKKKPNFFKFTIEDPTGRIQCVYFPSDKTFEKAKLLQKGKEILVTGKLEFNEYMGNKTLQMTVRSICYCTLPQDFKVNRLKFKPSLSYKFIHPQPYIEYNQQSIFAAIKDPAQFLKGREFVVFDLETTGLNPLSDKIIEIGAVKIKDGIITETFSAFVDPERPLPEKITDLTGITNADLKDACLIGEVLPDFYHFCGAAMLVGHNSEYFDYPFLSAAANKLHIYFDNDRLDTMLLAGQYLKLKNLKLQTLAEHFNIKNEQAHRAVYDAITTAKIFMLLAEYLGKAEGVETA